MAQWTHFFLIRIEFLGFRFHGWQKQGNLNTIQGKIDKTISHILGHENFRTLGCGRTDAKVSADDFVLELFSCEDREPGKLLDELNKNLPPDIRAKSLDRVGADFNIIKHPKIKEYHYLFSYGTKIHPFNAPFIRNFGATLDIEKMMKAAKVFEGTHNFKRYAGKPTAKTIFEREIVRSVIEPNTTLIAGFAPAQSYVFKVTSKGFLRYQVRLMMGALIDVGQGLCTIDDLKQSLTHFDGMQMKHIVPASALRLHRVCL